MKIRSLTMGMLLLIASAVQAQNFEIQYQSDTGALDLVQLGDTAATTVELKSEGGQITGDRPAHFNGLFDVYTPNKAFKLDPAGFGSTPGFAFIAAGATGTDITVDGSLVGGGPLGTVALVFPTVEPATSVTWSPAIASGTMVTDLIGGQEIPFTAAEYPGSTSDTGTFFTGDGGDTGNADLNTVLNSHGWNADGATVVVDGLTTGNDYQIQLLMGDTRGCCADRTQTASDGTNVSEPFSRAGGSVVGSFTAASDSLSLEIAGATDPGLSGYILYDATAGSVSAVNFTSDGVSPTVVVPEPSSIVLSLIALAGLFGRRRRS